MSSYGVPEELEGALPWSWAEQRLVGSRNYWLTTVDPNGRPHSMPLWGVWDPDSTSFWFAIARDSLKARNISRNPHVVLTADDTVEVVSVEGTAEAVDADRDVASLWGHKYGEGDDSVEELIEFFSSEAMYRVSPTKAFGLIESEEEFSRSATRWVF